MGSEMTLDEMKPGAYCTINKLSAADRLGQRLLDMGVYPGLDVKVIRNAPLEDPMEVELGGYNVSLRHAEARLIEVDPR
jgi:ferrous iron transport protein A